MPKTGLINGRLGGQMYAVIKSGGKQHKVQEGDVILLEKLAFDEGKKVTFDDVLLVAKDKDAIVDAKALAKVSVVGTVLEQIKDDKITVFKYKAKKGYKVKQGHRQRLSKVKIDKINV